MANFTTANVQTSLTNYTSSQLRTFASDCSSNFTSAFTSRWSCTARQQSGLNDTRSSVRTLWIAALNNFADEIDNGVPTKDFSGLSITNTSGTGTYGGVKWTVHFDIDVTYSSGIPILYVASCWFTFDTHS